MRKNKERTDNSVLFLFRLIGTADRAGAFAGLRGVGAGLNGYPICSANAVCVKNALCLAFDVYILSHRGLPHLLLCLLCAELFIGLIGLAYRVLLNFNASGGTVAVFVVLAADPFTF